MLLSRSVGRQSPALRLAAQGVGVGLLTLLVMALLSGRELPLLTAAVAGLFCLLLFRHPHWGVVAIFTFWFLRISPTLLGSRFLQLTHIIAALLFVPLAVRLLRDREIWVWRVPQVRALLGIGSIFFVSTLWSDAMHPLTFFPQLDKTVPWAMEFITHVVFLVFFLYFINTRGKLHLIVWLVVALIVVSVVDAYVKMFTTSGLRRINASFGLGQSPTVFPYVALFGTSLLWCYYTATQTIRWKGWVTPCLVALPVIALATGSRTALLQLVTFSILVFMDRSGGWSRTQRVRGLVLLVCVLIVMSLVVPTIAVLRSTSFETSTATSAGQSLKHRLQTVYDGLAMTVSSPILGVGLGNFLWVHTTFYGLKAQPHNSYLWAMAEGGVGVLVLYLMLFYATYRMLRRLETTGPPDMLWLAKAFRFNLILLLVYSLTDDAWLHDLPFLIVAATIVLDRLWRRQLPAASPVPNWPHVAQRPAPAIR